jgi:TATA-box binding protein (TBP) (component of TFIID and TFIIIB)
MYRICNVVAVGEFGCQLDLNTIAACGEICVDYRPRVFSGLLIRTPQPRKSHCQLYCNGKFTVNGAKSEEDAKDLSGFYCKLVQKLGFSTAVVKNFKVVNIVASVDFERQIDLAKIKTNHPRVVYEPEIFPGLTIRFEDATCVLFHTGKCNVLGAKEELDIKCVLLELYLMVGLWKES